MKLDLRRLNADRLALEARIHAAKRKLRTTWTEPMWVVQADLLSAKLAVTHLYIVRAHARGKVHIPKRAQWCHDIAVALLLRYQRPPARALG